MSNRLIKVNKEEAKNIQKKLNQAKNDTERKRITIVYQYLWWMNMNQVSDSLLVWKQTVVNIVNAYKESPKSFFKTKWRWRIENEEIKKLKQQTREFIEKKQKEWSQIDINDVKDELEKKNKQDFHYSKIHRLIRNRLWLNYQKPYVTSAKQNEYAKDIAEWRLRKAIYQIGLEEWEIDVESVKNKKTKFWQFIL